MATWQLIEHTGLTLVRVLQDHIDAALPTSAVAVQLATTACFGELKHATRPTVTVFLYRVIENSELRNSPMQRRPDGTLARQPMALELCYLITPWGVRADESPAADLAATREELRLSGLILQALYDRAELSRAELVDDPDPARPRVWGPSDAIQLVLESLPVEDLYRIWDASELGYRMSMTYRARVLSLDSGEVLRTSRVADARLDVIGGTS